MRPEEEEEEEEDAGCFCSIIRTPGSRVNFWGVAGGVPVPADAPHPLLGTLAIVTGAAGGGESFATFGFNIGKRGEKDDGACKEGKKWRSVKASFSHAFTDGHHSGTVEQRRGQRGRYDWVGLGPVRSKAGW